MLLMSTFVAEVIVHSANEEEGCVWYIALTSNHPSKCTPSSSYTPISEHVQSMYTQTPTKRLLPGARGHRG